jgi:hypothetical protein
VGQFQALTLTVPNRLQIAKDPTSTNGSNL